MADLFTIAAVITCGFWTLCAWDEIDAGDGDVFDILIFAWHGTVAVLGLAILSNRLFA